MSIRIKMKVWTDHVGQRRAVGLGIADLKSEDTGVTAFVLGEETVEMVRFTLEEWNKLPFIWLKEDGEAPRHGVTV